MRRIVLAAALVAALIPAAPALATAPGSNGLIAYTARTSAPTAAPAFAIYTVSPNGSGSRQLVANAVDPAWSPNGKQIAYTRLTSGSRFGDIYVANANGSKAKKVLANASNPTWSPNGQQLAYVRQQGSGPQPTGDSVWVAKANGKGARQVAAGSGGFLGEITDVDWAPTGSTLVYANAVGLTMSSQVTISTVSASGGSSTQLVNNDAPAVSGNSVTGLGVSWSPSGASIATQGTAATTVLMASSQQSSLPYFGGQMAFLAYPGGAATYVSSPAKGLDWSPDGTLLCGFNFDANGFPTLVTTDPSGQTLTSLATGAAPNGAGRDCDWQTLPS